LKNLDAARLAGLIAEEARRFDPATIHHEGGASFAAPQSNGIANTESSAMLSRAVNADKVFGTH
jgi:hypothetical protein